MLGGVCLEIFFHLADVDAADGAEHKILLGDVANFHGTVVFAIGVLDGSRDFVLCEGKCTAHEEQETCDRHSEMILHHLGILVKQYG